MSDNKPAGQNGRFKEIMLYLFFGVCTTAVSWCTYALFSIVFKPITTVFIIFSKPVSLSVILANTVSIFLAILFAFLPNKIWVFGSRDFSWGVMRKEMYLFFSTRALTALLEFIIVPALSGIGFDSLILSIPLVQWFRIDQLLNGMDGAVSKIAASFIVVVLNYIFSKLIIFKKKDNK